MKREELDIPVPDLRRQRGLEYTCPSASWGDMTGLIPYAAEDDAEAVGIAETSLEELLTTALMEAQIESMVVAKGYTDCVAYISDEQISLAVAAPEAGLQDTDVALLADLVVSQTDYDLSAIRIIEVGKH